jgi:predicted GNAT family acetyltransferase
MITKLNAQHKEEVINYLKQESTFNIFIIGDIEAFGMETDFQKIYGEYDAFGVMQSVLLIYQKNVCYYTHTNRLDKEYIEILNQYPFEFISGKESLVKLFLPYFPSMSAKAMIFSEMSYLKEQTVYPNLEVKEAITETDFRNVFRLLAQIEEFSMNKKDEDKYVEDQVLWSDRKTTYFIEKDGIAIATATATAETNLNAMVVAVATDPNHRNQGYATVVMKALIHKYGTIKQKDLCLFYDNPSAGKIYERLGFKPIGKWLMLSKKAQ